MKDKMDETLVYYQQVLSLEPDNLDACLNLGARLQERGDLIQAKLIYQNFISCKSDCAEVYCNLGIVLIHLGNAQQAIDAFKSAIRYKPELSTAYYNLGNALQIQGDIDAAEHAYRQTIQRDPKHKNAHNNLGNILQTKGDLVSAEQHLNSALGITCNDAQALNNLANVYKHQGLYDKAVEYYRKALALEPNNLGIYSNLLYALSADRNCSPSHYLAHAKAYGEKAAAIAKPFQNYLTSHGSNLGQRIRVGFVSGDLKSHPVGFFLENTLHQLDQSQFELFAYSTVSYEDELTHRIKPYFSQWQVIAGMNDRDAACKIHADKIDLLVDLVGHTALNRLPIFAWRPAPIQVSWLGYFASTGLCDIDYLIADPISVPESHRLHFVEKIWYLPETRLCFTPPTDEIAASVSSLPAIKNGYITLGCYQMLPKLNNDVLEQWAKILKILPQARLRLQNKQFGCEETRQQMVQRMTKLGIDQDRIMLYGPQSRNAYLASHSEVDMLLDTFPYPGGTTTCEALWMGVPTLTLAGETLLARQGASILSAAGLSDWIAENVDDYVAKAVKLSSHLSQLAELRSGLRERLRHSPLMDAKRFANNLGEAFREMVKEKYAHITKDRMAEDTTEKILLHVGCGSNNKVHTTQGFNINRWREIRLDVDETVNPDIVGSMTNMADVDDAAVDAIFSSHNIEHLYAHEVPIAVKEFLRVLKPDGFLVVTCPDLQSVCALVANDKLTEPAYTSPAGPISPIDMLYGYRPFIEQGKLHMAHKCGFTKKVLVGTLRSAGFMTVAAINRDHPHYDLWAVASKSEIAHDTICQLAAQHFPAA